MNDWNSEYNFAFSRTSQILSELQEHNAREESRDNLRAMDANAKLSFDSLELWFDAQKRIDEEIGSATIYYTDNVNIGNLLSPINEFYSSIAEGHSQALKNLGHWRKDKQYWNWLNERTGFFSIIHKNFWRYFPLLVFLDNEVYQLDRYTLDDSPDGYLEILKSWDQGFTEAKFPLTEADGNLVRSLLESANESRASLVEASKVIDDVYFELVEFINNYFTVTAPLREEINIEPIQAFIAQNCLPHIEAFNDAIFELSQIKEKYEAMLNQQNFAKTIAAEIRKTDSPTERLESLQGLLDKGLVTKEEFDTKRQEILKDL